MDYGTSTVWSGIFNTLAQKKSSQYNQMLEMYAAREEAARVKKINDDLAKQQKDIADIENYAHDIIFGDGISQTDKDAFLTSMAPYYKNIQDVINTAGTDRNAMSNPSVMEAINLYKTNLVQNPHYKKMEQNSNNLGSLLKTKTENPDAIYRSDWQSYADYNDGLRTDVRYSGERHDYFKNEITQWQNENFTGQQLSADEIYYMNPQQVKVDFFNVHGREPINDQEALGFLNYELQLDESVPLFGEKKEELSFGNELFKLIDQAPLKEYTAKDLISIYQDGGNYQDIFEGKGGGVNYSAMFNVYGGHNPLKAPEKYRRGFTGKEYRQLIGSNDVITDPLTRNSIMNTLFGGEMMVGVKDGKTFNPEGKLIMDGKNYILKGANLENSNHTWYDDRGSRLESDDWDGFFSNLVQGGPVKDWWMRSGTVNKLELEGMHIAFTAKMYDPVKDRQTEMLLMNSTNEKDLQTFLDNNGELKLQPTLVAQWRDKDPLRDEMIYMKVPLENVNVQDALNKQIDPESLSTIRNNIDQSKQEEVVGAFKQKQIQEDRNLINSTFAGGNPNGVNVVVDNYISPLESSLSQLGINPKLAPLVFSDIYLNTLKSNSQNPQQDMMNGIYNFSKLINQPENKEYFNNLKLGFSKASNFLLSDKDEAYTNQMNEMIRVWTNILTNTRNPVTRNSRGLNIDFSGSK